MKYGGTRLMSFGGRRAQREQGLGRQYRAALKENREEEFFATLSEALEQKHLKPDDLSVARLFEQFVTDANGEPVGSQGRTTLCDPAGGENIQEAVGSGAVDTGSFANVSGQIVYTMMLDAFMSESFTVSALIPVVNTIYNGEKIPGVSRLGDVAEKIGEGEEYPTVGFGEDYIETAETQKKGMIVPLTKEVIYFDRTGLVLQRASEVGEFIGLEREKRAVDCLIDENAGATSIINGGHRYHWKGTSYATYQTSTPWDNVTANAGLTDWTDIDEALQTLEAITDPFTGEPVMMGFPTHIVVTRQNLATARYIVNANQVRVATANSTYTSLVQGNMIEGDLQIVSSQMLAAQMATDTTWYLGQPQKAFCEMVNWPLAVIQAPMNSEAEFTKDIVLRFKGSRRAVYATKQPRLMTKCTA